MPTAHHRPPSPPVRPPPSALWAAALPEAERPPGWRLAAGRDWHPQWGDRRQRIVFIGAGMDEGGLRAMLDGCLLDDDEMALGPGGWAAAFPDDLPSWDDEEHDHEEAGGEGEAGDEWEGESGDGEA